MSVTQRGQMRTLVSLLVIHTTRSVIRTTEDVNRLGEHCSHNSDLRDNHVYKNSC